MFNFSDQVIIVDYSFVSASTAFLASSSSESLASSLSFFLSERPSSIAAPKAFTNKEMDLKASSLAGIGKSTSFGLEFVSTSANTGIPSFFRSEERRVGKEGYCRWTTHQSRK